MWNSYYCTYILIILILHLSDVMAFCLWIYYKRHRSHTQGMYLSKSKAPFWHGPNSTQSKRRNKTKTKKTHTHTTKTCSIAIRFRSSSLSPFSFLLPAILVKPWGLSSFFLTTQTEIVMKWNIIMALMADGRELAKYFTPK